MTRVYEIREMAAVIAGMRGAFNRASSKAMIATIQNAEAQAKRNAAGLFKGSDERPKSGNLLNSIYSGYKIGSAKGSKFIAEGFVGTRAKYGRIQELGGTVKPVKANSLWIPQFGPGSGGDKAAFKNLTPTLFMAAMLGRKLKGGFAAWQFVIFKNLAGAIKKAGGRNVFVPLFILKKSVYLPPRPFIMPALSQEWAKFGDRLQRFLAEEPIGKETP